MVYEFDYSEEKDLILKATRGISFEDVIEALGNGKLIDDIDQESSKYPNQKILVVEINKYIYVFQNIFLHINIHYNQNTWQ